MKVNYGKYCSRYRCTWNHSISHSQWHTYGFPAPGHKVSLGASAQPVSGSIDVKSKLGLRGVES